MKHDKVLETEKLTTFIMKYEKSSLPLSRVKSKSHGGPQKKDLVSCICNTRISRIFNALLSLCKLQ